MTERVDVVIIGAGLAGLAAACALEGQRSYLLLEGSDRLGGRMRSRRIDGYLIDEGFQVVNPYYPELRRLGLLDELNLRPLIPGVEVSLGRAVHTLGDPRRAPGLALSSALAPVGSPLAKARLALYALHAATSAATDLIEQDDQDFKTALLKSGISEVLYRTVLRPFLLGVFLDDPEHVSRRYGDLVLRSFVRGNPSLPENGSAALPQTLASRIDAARIRVSTKVVALGDGYVETDAGRIEADALIVATDPRSAAAFTGVTAAPATKSCVTYYFAMHAAPSRSPILRIDGRDRGPVINSVVLSAAVPSYAPPGMHLVQATTLSSSASADEERAVRAHLALLWGVDTRNWQLVEAVSVPDALPAQRPGRPIARPQQIGAAIWVAGDHMDTPSQQGALVSGRRAARAVLGT